MGRGETKNKIMNPPIKKVLITGGTGFIGSHLADRVINEGGECVVLDNLSTGFMKNLEHHRDASKITILRSSIGIVTEMALMMRGCDTVFHFQANADVRGGETNHTVDLWQNTISTHLILSAMQIAGVKRIVFASSAVVYGEPSTFPTPETYAPIQTSHYGASKLSCEAMIQAFAHYGGWQYFIFRMVSILGPRYSHGCVVDFRNKLKANPRELEILGDGNQMKSFLDVGDAVDGIFAAIQGGESGIYNLGHGETATALQIARWVADEMGLTDAAMIVNQSPTWKGDSPRVMLDTSKLRRSGWRPSMGIEEAVRRTVRYLASNDS